MQKVHLRRTKRLHAGHLWVFSNEIHESMKQYEPGSLVEVLDMQENYIGSGYINPNSLIAVRLLTRKRQKIDSDFLRRRITDALRYRERFLAGQDAFRFIYSEAD